MDAAENSMKVKKRKGKRNNRKKGFTDEQIRLLETMFESETKPEPHKKVELATELGLQPRQVAIWFQNRRARWKSKRIEQDYNVLRDSYDGLVAVYETLKKEHHDLRVELQMLTEILGRSNESSKEGPNPVDEDTVAAEPPSFVEDMRFQLLNIEEEREEKEEEDDEDGSLGTLEERWCNFGSNCSAAADDFSLSSTPWWNTWT